MEERNINKTMLAQYARRLHVVSGKLNLYIDMCYRSDCFDMDRLASEIQSIHGLIASIESELKCIWAESDG